jgi:hypothetical protein
MVKTELNFSVCPKNLRLLYTNTEFFVSRDIVLFGFNIINKKYSPPESAKSNQVNEDPKLECCDGVSIGIQSRAFRKCMLLSHSRPNKTSKTGDNGHL